jgi:putative intracellular protease/amidase
VLDRSSLVGVHLNPELRVKVARGPAGPALADRDWRPFLAKVHNESGATAALRATSDHYAPLTAGRPTEWSLCCNWKRALPMGAPRTHRVVHVQDQHPLQWSGTMAKVLMVLTSHDRLGDTGQPTGFWLEEFAAPYYVLRDAGIDVTLASPKGGAPPVDPKSDDPKAETPAMKRFKGDREAQRALASTVRLSSVAPDDYDAVFYPGGHGPLWDLAEDRSSIALIEKLYAAGKPVAAVCHGPAVLRHAKAPDGTPLVRGKAVTGFTNTEEAAAGLTDVVPFLVEDALKANGGKYSRAEDWADHTVADGNLITGQNPASSESAAKALLERLEAKVEGSGAAAGAGAGRRS